MNFPILSENRSNPSVRYRNYYCTQKTAGKVSALFRCSSVNCYASMYEEARSTQRIKSATTIPDYKDIKDGLKKRKSRKFKF
jgi:hypothetical protein